VRQIWITRRGGPEVLQVKEAPDPVAGEGQVRVRVAAAGVNFADTMARIGLYPDAPKLPTVVGYEVAGTVDQVGAGVNGIAAGARVCAITRFGGYSDVVCVPRDFIYPLPEGMDLHKAAALPVAYVTAWAMLVYLGNVRRGDTVLIHAAAGGVGIAAVQICKLRGAEIFGTASAGKHARLRELGVTHCIDYTKEDFAAEIARLTKGRGVDVILDAVGGVSFQKSYASLAPLGRLFLYGGSAFSSGKTRNLFTILKAFFAMPKFGSFDLMDKNRGVFGVNLGHLWGEHKRLSQMMEEILALADRGQLDPVVDKTFPFEQAGDAHAYLQDRKNFGKIVLVP
jgi:NADPH:quinone reductase-like Zn-dependent oxidoreductase